MQGPALTYLNVRVKSRGKVLTHGAGGFKMPKTYKTTKTDFELFKAECLRWVEKLGLKDWCIEYVLEDLKEELTFARAHSTYSSRIAKIVLNEKIGAKLTNSAISNTALHEVLHIVHAKCYGLMVCAFKTEDEINEADHELVVRLTNVLMELDKQSGD